MINGTKKDAARYSRLLEDAKKRQSSKHQRSTNSQTPEPKLTNIVRPTKPRQAIKKPTLDTYGLSDPRNESLNLELMSPSFHQRPDSKCAKSTVVRSSIGRFMKIQNHFEISTTSTKQNISEIKLSHSEVDSNVKAGITLTNQSERQANLRLVGFDV